ncbi:MAG: hypothetical protein VKM92_07225 [Cyanobacteriota bacterium]|nr:hypothetical protein [Cyanobacteriota bacterium]
MPQSAPPPALPMARQWRWLRSLVLALALLLTLSLSACAKPGAPPQATVLEALTLQIDLTQQAIADTLGLPAAGTPRVSHVRIEDQRSIAIGDGRGLHLSGHFDWRLADDPTLVESPFELDLQRGERGQSWRLARPAGPGAQGQSQQWLIDPLPING